MTQDSEAGNDTLPPNNSVAGEETISRAEFARLVNVSRSVVTRAIERGRISPAALGPGKALYKARALADWTRHRDPQQPSPVPPPAPSEADGAPPPREADPAVAGFRDARTRREMAVAARAEMDLAIARRQLLDRRHTEHAIETCGGHIADALDQIERWAVDLAAEFHLEERALRRALRDKAQAMRAKIAARLTEAAERLGTATPDDPDPDDEMRPDDER